MSRVLFIKILFFTCGGAELREELEQPLSGQTIGRLVYENIVMRDLEKADDLVWSFLLFSGYLTIIERWFKNKVKLLQLETILIALEHGDVRLFERMLRVIVTQVMSYHDLSGQSENVYQALVLGMLTWFSPKYGIRTNRESGYGRYDMMFMPKSGARQEILLEFKRVYEDEQPETVLNDALQQKPIRLNWKRPA